MSEKIFQLNGRNGQAKVNNMKHIAKTLLATLLAIGIALSLVSCGDSTDDTADTSKSPTTTPTATETEATTEEQEENKVVYTPSEIGIDSQTLGSVVIDDYLAQIGAKRIDVDEAELQSYAETCGAVIFEEAGSESLGEIKYFENANTLCTLFSWYCDIEYSDLAYLKMVGYDGSEVDSWNTLRELMIQYSILGDRLLHLEYDDTYHSIIVLFNEQNGSLTLMAACNGEIIYDATEDETIQLYDDATVDDVLNDLNKNT